METTKINGVEFEMIQTPPKTPRKKHVHGQIPINKPEDTIESGNPSRSGFHIRARISRKINKAKAKFHEFNERLSSRFSSKQQRPQPNHQKIHERKEQVKQHLKELDKSQKERGLQEQQERPPVEDLSVLISKEKLAKLSSLEAQSLPEQIVGVALGVVQNPVGAAVTVLQAIDNTDPNDVLEAGEEMIRNIPDTIANSAASVAQTAEKMVGQALDIAGHAATEAKQTAATLVSDAAESAAKSAGAAVQAAGTTVQDIAYEVFVSEEQKLADKYFEAVEERSPNRYENPETKAAKKLEKVAHDFELAAVEAERARLINLIIQLDPSQSTSALKNEALGVLEVNLLELQQEAAQEAAQKMKARDRAIHIILDVEPSLDAETLEQMPLDKLEQLAQYLFAKQQASVSAKSLDVWEIGDDVASIIGSVAQTVGTLIEESLSASVPTPTQAAPPVPRRRNIQQTNMVEVEI